LELPADNREVALKKGGRSTSTTAFEVEHTHPGVKLDTESKEDNHGERSGTVWRRLYKISRRRKTHARRVLILTSVPCIFEVGAPI
jgi:hypothetical protein